MTLENSREEMHLAQADHHIAEAEERLARQKKLIEELTTDGHDTTDAKLLLQTLEATLKTMYEHRQLLLHEGAARGTVDHAR